MNGEIQPAHLCLQFRVFLVSAQTGKHTQESRTLQFWFTNTLTETDQPSVAQEFFRELVSPQEFPRGKYTHSFAFKYVMFIFSTCFRVEL